MNKILKSIFIVCFCMIFSLKADAAGIHQKNSEKILQEAKEYALEVLPDMLASVKNDSSFQVDIQDYDQLYIGQPYTIPNIKDGKITNEKDFDFPVLEGTEIKLILSVSFSQGEWHAMLSTELTEALNALPESGAWTFYSEDGIVYAESSDDMIILSNHNEQDKGDFAKSSYQLKRKTLHSFDTYNKSDIRQKWEDTTVNTNMVFQSTYNTQMMRSSSIGANSSSPFLTYTSNNKILNMSGCKVSQGNSSICWAAATATIVRYIKGNVTLTALDVCNKIYHDASGGSSSDIMRALDAYGITYVHTGLQLDWYDIGVNIVNKKPICAAATSGPYDHAVVIYGVLHNTDTLKNYINIWNPGNNTSSTITYSSNRTTFEYGNLTFTWTQTVSAYN